MAGGKHRRSHKLLEVKIKLYEMLSYYMIRKSFDTILGFIFGSCAGMILGIIGYVFFASALLSGALLLFGPESVPTNIVVTVVIFFPFLLFGYIFFVGPIIESLKRPSQSPKYSFSYRSSIRRFSYNKYPEDWPELRKAALERDEYKCGNCGGAQKLMVHHIVPLSKGGSNQLSNLRTLCEGCHKKLHPYMK